MQEDKGGPLGPLSVVALPVQRVRSESGAACSSGERARVVGQAPDAAGAAHVELLDRVRVEPCGAVGESAPTGMSAE